METDLKATKEEDKKEKLKTARRILLKLNDEEKELVDHALKECARCWNDIVDIANEYYKETGRWIYKYDLQKLLKHKYDIQYNSCCALTIKYNTARLIASKMKKQGFSKIKYPYKYKEYMTLPLKKDCIRKAKDGNLKLSLGGHKYLLLNFFIDNIKTAEIKRTYSDKYYFYYTKEYEYENCDNNLTQKAGIDIGYNNCIALCHENGNALIIDNKPAKSIKKRRNKSRFYLSNAIKKCTYGSKKYKKLLAASENIQIYSHNFLTDFYHKAVNQMIKYCIDNGIGELVIGDLKNISDKSKKKEKICNKICRIWVSQMEYGRIMKYIEYKSKEYGIKVSKVAEYYTSQQCPRCKVLNKPDGSKYKCNYCGLMAHRDCVGAFNNLNKKYKVEYHGFDINFIAIK